MKLNEIYEKAAAVIVRNGHNKGCFYDAHEEYAPSDAPVCAVGALSLVTTGDPQPPEDHPDALDEALSDLARRVDSNVIDMDGIERIADWNDREERTQAEVVALLLNAAKAVA